MSSHWQAVALGDICQIQIGGTPSRSEDAYWWKSNEDGERLPWVSISDLQERVITSTKEGITRLGLERSNAKRVPQGTLLMSFKLTIGKLAFAGRDLHTNEAIASLRTSDSVYPEFLYYGLQYWDLTVNTDQAIKGVTLNKQKLQEIPCLLPPLPEQKKIAEILSGIDRLIKTHSAKKSKMSDLLVAMRARIFTNASGKEVSLGELCSPKQWPTISADKITKTGYPVYGANGQIGFYSEYNHKDPVLAVTCRGATCGNLNLIPGFSYVTGNSMCLDNLSKDISIQYLYHFLAWRGLSDVLSGSAQPQITRTPLQAVQIVVPAKQRQSEVVSMLAAIATLHDHEKEMIARLENLKNAVSIDLLSGRKRVTI